ncbi:MAG TPA: hypothetical protein VG276_17110 [Actinomycetes bacterium]|nr:hypothetical protein [Actinomycetes bacterium]
MARSRFRRPWLLPPAARPRVLSTAEAAAVKARPWPRLPWWLWLAVVATTVAMVTVAVGLVGQGGQPDVPLGARRPAPVGRLSHDVGDYRVPALDPANRARVTRRHPDCARLATVTLAGTPGEVLLLEQAADRTCGLRSTEGVRRARDGLSRAAATVAFAEFQVTGNESTTLFAPGGPLVLVNGKFSQTHSLPERIATLLVHEGVHVADGGPPTAAGELAADRAQLDACQRLLPDPEEWNVSCRDAAALLALGETGALDQLRRAGYR